MPEEEKKNQDFSTYGTESFKLGKGKPDDGSKKSDDKSIILNILEEDEAPVSSGPPVVYGQTAHTGLVSTGNPILDWYNSMNLALAKKSKVKVDIKANFFHLLAVMISAGIPMVKSLKSLVAQSTESPKLKFVIEELAQSIVSGDSLSRAMMQFPDVFTEQELGMLQAGEASGQLAKVLEVLAHDTAKASAIKKKVKSALMYPAVIFTLLIAVIIVMLVFVIPQLSELFISSGNELPLITRIVVGLSDFFINQKYILISAVVGLGIFIFFFKKTPAGKYFFDKLLISIPIFGILFKKSFLSRFARSLNNLLDSSVTILKTMEITAKSIGNEVYKKRLLMSLEDIKQGIPLAENLSESDLFPPMLISMIEVGEQTAQLDTIMAQVADFYEMEVDTAVEGISKIIEPVILIIIGVTVGAVVAAIMLPIMQLSNVAGSL